MILGMDEEAEWSEEAPSEMDRESEPASAATEGTGSIQPQSKHHLSGGVIPDTFERACHHT